MDKLEKIQVKITKIEKEIRETPYHKGTQHYIGLLRARLSQLEDRLTETSGKGKSLRFAVKKQGEATIVFIGFPSVGKSTLINLLTNVHSRVAEYAFTTVTAIPGMMRYKGANLQLIDLPGFIGGAATGKGHGKEILSVARNADLLLLVYDLTKPEQLELIKKELTDSEIKNQYVAVGNKVDLIKETKGTKEPNEPEDLIRISAQDGEGLEELREKIWQKLGLMRVYLKRKNGKVDYESPLIMEKGQTVQDALLKTSNELVGVVKEAKVWGASAKFPGQIVSLSHQLRDEDILTLVT